MRPPREHFSPQGYLRGFIHPKRIGLHKPLWVFEVARQEWVERSEREIGYRRGFYAPVGGFGAPDFLENVFQLPERTLPQIRDSIRGAGFESWRTHRDSLVTFAAMLSSRNPLFLRQATESTGDADAAQARAKALEAITNETVDRSRRWVKLNWVLRFCDDAGNAIPTCDHAVGMEGSSASITLAATQPDTTIYFPLSWDMCLIGSRSDLGTSCDRLQPAVLQLLRTYVSRSAEEFIASPEPFSVGA